MNKVILSILILILILAGIFAFWYRSERNAMLAVRSFEECARNGYPVMESYPRQCRTPDGRNFVEDIKEEPKMVTGGEAFVAKYPLTSNIALNQKIVSPLLIEGVAWGPWFFEANLPITLVDAEGKVLAQVGAQATSEWMTEGKVPFKTTLVFAATTSKTGTLIFAKDNPSGLSEHDAEVRIPITFK